VTYLYDGYHSTTGPHAMLAMLLIFTICATNFAIGFALAVRNGHGPTELPLLKKLMSKSKPQAESH